MDRRITFFLIAAIVSLLLLPLSPPEFRIVCEITAAVYVVLALAVALDQWSRRRDERARAADDPVTTAEGQSKRW